MGHPENESQELMLMAGKCLAAWSGVEMSLRELFVRLNGISDMTSPLAAAFDSVQSFEVRLNMLNTLIRADHGTDDGKFRPAWNALHNALSRNKRRRAEVAHFAIVKTIGVNQTENDVKFELQPFFTLSSFTIGQPKRLSAQMLCAREEAFKTLRQRLANLALYIAVVRGIGPEADRQVADPDRLLENPNAQNPKGKKRP